MKKQLIRLLLGGGLIFGALLIGTAVVVLAQTTVGLYIETALAILLMGYLLGYMLLR